MSLRWVHSIFFVLLVSLGLAALWDYLFWGWPLGISAAIFAGALSLILMLRTPVTLKTGQGRLMAAVTLLAVAALVESPSILAITMVLVFLGTLVLVSRRDVNLLRDTVPVWMGRWFLLGLTLWMRIFRDKVLVIRWIFRHPHLDKRFFRVLKAIAWWVLPLIAGAFFLGLFALANPVIAQFFGHLREMVDRFFLWLIQLQFSRMALWILVIMLTYGLLRHRHTWGSKVRLPPVAAPPSSAEWLTGPQMIIRLLLVMNLVFAVENVLDAAYLYAGVPLPAGMMYKEYAHRGAYTLIATALLAGIFTLVAFRQSGSAHRSKACRWLVYAWIVQNILLLVSTVDRVWQYVDMSELTRLRTATMIWCGIVAAGFAWIILRIKHGRSNAWLWRMNAFTALGVLLVCAFINFDGLIADFNVRHCAEAGGNGYGLDWVYLEHLGPPALPAVVWIQAHPGKITPEVRARLDEVSRELRRQLAEQLRDWRGWTYRRQREEQASQIE